MAFEVLIGIGGFLLILGSLILIVDALRTRWFWGAGIASSLFLSVVIYQVAAIPFHMAIFAGLLLLTALVSMVFACLHWSNGKRGCILQILSLPLLVTAFALQSASNKHPGPGKSDINDPLAEAMNRTRLAIAKIESSRAESPARPTPTPGRIVIAAPVASVVPVSQSAPPSKPAAPLTLQQRLSANRHKFKQLAEDFKALSSKRLQLTKNDLPSIHDFNNEATRYARDLAAARTEQEELLALQRK